MAIGLYKKTTIKTPPSSKPNYSLSLPTLAPLTIFDKAAFDLQVLANLHRLENAGVRVAETYLLATLSEQLPFEPSKEVYNPLPPVEGDEELLHIQLNRYACSGLVIGQTAHHRVSDGQSMSAFCVT
ncbi:hypothetical protein Sjap_003174 [Stephania japonica]|uniref:Uncharacterized protein n=1 Tax=Stephania japonica TaxID=461633 RepID=A0AAP0PV76_9MAGN